MTNYNRRTLLKASAAIAGASAIGFPAISYGQTEKIRIGHLTPLTGFLGALGAYATLGMRTAEEEINKAGGVMGRPIEVMSEDSVNPATAATKAQRMLEQDGATVLMGEISSASAITIMQVAARNKRLFMQIGTRSARRCCATTWSRTRSSSRSRPTMCSGTICSAPPNVFSRPTRAT